MATVAYHTLGCKVNQCETESIRQSLEAVGFATVPFNSAADIYIINTCTVTAAADSKSRSAIRRARRANPDGLVVITGCWAELNLSDTDCASDADVLVGNSDKHEIAERIAARFGSQPAVPTDIRPRLRTRAMVKAQDGCDQFCTYCVVPLARRGMRSRSTDDLEAEIRSLAGFGYREVVLTGIRLGAYDSNGQRLPDLLRRVREVPGIRRIRLSSIEPWEVDDALLDAMDHPVVCRHLHIPLQSGDDEVLQRMNRPYSAEQYRRIAAAARNRIPGIGITTDVIAGFPGETARAFENTCRMIQDTNFARIHVFRYSSRPGTAAAGMDAQLDAREKKRRASELAELGRQGAVRFAEGFVGKILNVLVEPRSKTAEHQAGFADNYLEVSFRGDREPEGRIAAVRVLRVDENAACFGERADAES